jgi:hypothetical protein
MGLGYALSRLPRGGYAIERQGQAIGRLAQDADGRWIASLNSDQRDMPPPFVRFEYVFPSLAEAFRWLGDPPVNKR